MLLLLLLCWFSKCPPLTGCCAVGHYHFAHSFVRGNWRREDESSFALLAKCCHDIDWCTIPRCDATPAAGSVTWLARGVTESRALGVSSISRRRTSLLGLQHGVWTVLWRVPALTAPRRWCWIRACNDVGQVYLDWAKDRKSFVGTATGKHGVPDIEEIEKSLVEGPYGRCVYDCDNDVCDNQVSVSVMSESEAIRW